MFLLLRENLVMLQVGFKSLTYEMQKQEPAYDSNSLFGKKSDLCQIIYRQIFTTPPSRYRYLFPIHLIRQLNTE